MNYPQETNAQRHRSHSSVLLWLPQAWLCPLELWIVESLVDWLRRSLKKPILLQQLMYLPALPWNSVLGSHGALGQH